MQRVTRRQLLTETVIEPLNDFITVIVCVVSRS